MRSSLLTLWAQKAFVTRIGTPLEFRDVSENSCLELQAGRAAAAR